MNNWNKFLQPEKSKIGTRIIEHKIVILFWTIILLLASILLSLCLGAANLTLRQLWKGIFEGGGAGIEGNIFWYARFPRTMACALAGAALAVSGAVTQTVLANGLASPGIIGVNAGAGFAVVLSCAMGAVGGWSVALSSFLGAMAAAFFVAFGAKKMGASRTTVILGGVAINSVLNAATEGMITLQPELSLISTDFKIGGFTSVVWERFLPAGSLIIIALLLLLSLTKELDLMGLGEETAQSLGLSAKTMRTLFLLLSALLAGCAVSFAGLLGFVGLMIPHLGRKIIGVESRYLLPFCIFFGAFFVITCDLGARILFQPYEVPVGILISFFGGLFFMYLLLKRKGGHRYD